LKSGLSGRVNGGKRKPKIIEENNMVPKKEGKQESSRTRLGKKPEAEYWMDKIEGKENR